MQNFFFLYYVMVVNNVPCLNCQNYSTTASLWLYSQGSSTDLSWWRTCRMAWGAKNPLRLLQWQVDMVREGSGHLKLLTKSSPSSSWAPLISHNQRHRTWWSWWSTQYKFEVSILKTWSMRNSINRWYVFHFSLALLCLQREQLKVRFWQTRRK